MKIKTIILLSLLTSCSAQKQNPLYPKNSDKFFTNKNFISENKFFGTHKESITEWIDKDGHTVKQYSRTQSLPGFADYLPIISFFIPRNYDNYELIVTFDKDGEVLNMRNFYNKASYTSVAFCNSSVGSCMRKIETNF